MFADIDPETYNISPKSVEEILEKEKDVKAVICVHLYGLPCNMDELLKLKEKYKFVLIEDACQAHLAEYKGRRVGAIGDAGAFSFYATKNMTTGEGGVVLTDNARIDALARKYINHGRTAHYEHDILGFNFRLTNIAAAMGIAQCESIEERTKQRIANAQKLSDGLKDADFLETPFVPKDYTHVYHQYTLRIKDGLRDKFMQYLKDSGIGCGIHYPQVVYKQPLYQSLGYKNGLCPEAEKAVEEVISIPVHPSLSEEDLNTIIKTIKGFKK